MKINLIYSKEDLDQTILQAAADRVEDETVQHEESVVEAPDDIADGTTEETTDMDTEVTDADSTDVDTAETEEADDDDDDAKEDKDEDASTESDVADAELIEAEEDLSAREEHFEEATEVLDEIGSVQQAVDTDRAELEENPTALRYATMAHRTILNRVGTPVSSTESYGSVLELEVELQHSLEGMNGIVERILNSITESWKRYGQAIAKRIGANKAEIDGIILATSQVRNTLKDHTGDVKIRTYTKGGEATNASKIIKEYETIRKIIMTVKDTGIKTLRDFISVSGEEKINKLCDDVLSGKALAGLAKAMTKKEDGYIYDGAFGKYAVKMEGSDSKAKLSCQTDAKGVKDTNVTMPVADYLKVVTVIEKFARDVLTILNELDTVANSDVKSIMKKDFGEISTDTARKLTRAISIARDISSASGYFRIISSVLVHSTITLAVSK